MNLIRLEDIRYFLKLFQRRKYLPVMDIKKKKIYVILSKDSCDVDVLKAYFHSSIYAMIISKMIGLYPV
jgi:aspartate/tyrosine/aromatic aminotransferase